MKSGSGTDTKSDDKLFPIIESGESNNGLLDSGGQSDSKESELAQTKAADSKYNFEPPGSQISTFGYVDID